MCERIPPECLPPRADPRRDLHPRRVVLAGLGSLLLTACAPARGRRERPRVRAVREARSAPVAPAYRIVPRSAWGAEPLKDNHDPMTGVTRITLHHTAEVAGMGTRTDAELMKGIQHFHRNTRGWADIGYHWVIGLDGNVYEGRALGVQGAHAGGGNNVGNLGISVIGEFTEALPGPRQLRTTEHFLAAQLAFYRLPAAALFGHRDFKPTECPGSALYAWLGAFKAARS